MREHIIFIYIMLILVAVTMIIHQLNPHAHG